MPDQQAPPAAAGKDVEQAHAAPTAPFADTANKVDKELIHTEAPSKNPPNRLFADKFSLPKRIFFLDVDYFISHGFRNASEMQVRVLLAEVGPGRCGAVPRFGRWGSRSVGRQACRLLRVF